MNKGFGQYIKSMAKINGRDVLPEVKMPVKRKPRSKETAPRNQPEAELRREVIKFFKKKGIRFWRIENSLSGYRGLPDLVFFHKDKMFFLELKKLSNLKEGQEEFQQLCLRSKTNHIVARSLYSIEIICSLKQ